MEYQLHASTPQAAGGVRTICVHGLPNDVRLRELRNLAVLLPGYESCHLAPGDGRRLVTGFVRFDSPTSAAHACERLQGLQFDEEMPHMRPLAVEIARRDLDDDRGVLGISPATRMVLMQLIQISFSLSAIFVFVRFFDTMSIFPALGELVTILVAMINDGKPIYIILGWSAIGFSAAITALLPQGNLSNEFFLRPFWYSFRAILGDFDIGAVYEILGDDGDSADLAQTLYEYAATHPASKGSARELAELYCRPFAPTTRRQRKSSEY